MKFESRLHALVSVHLYLMVTMHGLRTEGTSNRFSNRARDNHYKQWRHQEGSKMAPFYPGHPYEKLLGAPLATRL